MLTHMLRGGNAKLETQHTSTPNKKLVNAKCQSSDHRTEQNIMY